MPNNWGLNSILFSRIVNVRPGVVKPSQGESLYVCWIGSPYIVPQRSASELLFTITDQSTDVMSFILSAIFIVNMGNGVVSGAPQHP